MKGWLVAILLCCMAAAGGSHEPRQKESKSSPPLELRITASTQEFHTGGPPIVIRIEMHNIGKDEFIIGNSFVGIVSARSYVLVDVADEAGKHFILDAFNLSGLGIADAAKSWIRVEPRHYYGIEFPLDPQGYKFVNTPGSYKLTATYYSAGGDTPASPEWGVPSYPVWKGEIVSNTISIHVFKGTEKGSAEK